MVGSTKGPLFKKLSGFYRPYGASALKGGTVTCHNGCAHMIMPIMHWSQNDAEDGYLQDASRDLRDGCQQLTDGVLTGAHPPFTHIPAPFLVSCHLCI